MDTDSQIHTGSHYHHPLLFANILSEIVWLQWMWGEKKNRKLSTVSLLTLWTIPIRHQTPKWHTCYSWAVCSCVMVNSGRYRRYSNTVCHWPSIHFQFEVGNSIVKMYPFVFGDRFQFTGKRKKRRTECNWHCQLVIWKNRQFCVRHTSYSMRPQRLGTR